MRARALPFVCVSLASILAGCSDSGGGTLPGGPTTTSSGMTGTGVPATGAGAGGSDSTGGATSGGATTSSGVGGSDSPGSGGSGGSGSIPDAGPVIPGTFSRPKGQIPNTEQPAGKANLPEAKWADGLISPSMEINHHINQPVVLNGYLGLSGNAELTWYDIQDPTKPKQLSQIVSPGFDPKAGGKGEGEAESHQVAFAKYDDSFYEVTTSGTGVDIWNVTDVSKVKHVQSITLQGIKYGDFTGAVWGEYWQGDTIYVGGTDTGLHILDAKDPNNVKVVKRLTVADLGGVSAGPVYAIGNILVVTTPKESGGISLLDISDPLNPVRIRAITTGKSYIGAFYGHHLYLQSPLRVWDVLTDPTALTSSPISSLGTDGSEYMSFSDGYMFLGHLRPHPGASKINVTDPHKMKVESRIWGRHVPGPGGTVIYDDQFTIKIGSLLVMTDDEKPYLGAVIGVQSTEPDKLPPSVDTIIPKDKSTGVSIKSRIGISFTDNIEFATVNLASLIVRPMGGQPVPGNWGLYMGVLNFDPAGELLPKTTYEVVLPKGGLTDLVGNEIATEFKSTFTTQ